MGQKCDSLISLYYDVLLRVIRVLTNSLLTSHTRTHYQTNPFTVFKEKTVLYFENNSNNNNNNNNYYYYYYYIAGPSGRAAWVCVRSPAGIVGSIPTGGMVICLL
jgi:hypothetical protein